MIFGHFQRQNTEWKWPSIHLNYDKEKLKDLQTLKIDKPEQDKHLAPNSILFTQF